MPLSLKNAKATYQRMVNKIFKEEVGCRIEAYINDILVKSSKREDHADALNHFSKSYGSTTSS